jgi:hypothetical protein
MVPAVDQGFPMLCGSSTDQRDPILTIRAAAHL